MKCNSKKFHIRYKATLISSKKDNETRIWIAKPTTSIYQKIDNFLISPKPTSLYKDKQENKILYFRFKNTKEINFQMDIKTTLRKDHTNIDKKNILLPNSSSKLFYQYTKSEMFLEQTLEIKNLTYQITKNNKSILGKIQSIFNFISTNFEYCYPVKQRGVKYLNLNNLKGDCGEYSSLFVTMCRILKIPTRNNTGFVAFPKHKKIVEHSWTSVYLQPFGWLDFDTQYASLEKNTKKYFAQRNDYKLVFTNGFNIPLKPKIPQSFHLNYWNKLGLPLTNNSVQILQPIVFASKKNIKFEDKIELVL